MRFVHPYARVYAALSLATLAPMSCAVEPPLQQVSFSTRYAGAERDVSQPLVVQTSTGWTVSLSAAEVSIGPVYFYNGPAGSGTNESNGRVVAQILTPFTINALNPQWGLITGASTAVTDTALSASVWLTDTTEGPIAERAGARTAVAHVAGVAQKADRTVIFDAVLRVPIAGTTIAYQQWAQRHVTRIGTSLLPSNSGQMSVRVDASHWFDAVEFLDERQQPVDFSDRASAAQLLQGIRSARDTFHFTWQNTANSP